MTIRVILGEVYFRAETQPLFLPMFADPLDDACAAGRFREISNEVRY